MNRLRIGVLAFNKHIADEFSTKLRDPRQSVILPGSPEQESIFTAIADPTATRHVIVNALAGSGKSHTLLQSILRFRRRLQAAMVDVQAVTYNSYGWRACLKAFPGVQLDTDKTKRIVAEIVDEHLGLGNLDYTTKGEILGGIRQLTTLCKANLLDGTDRTALEDLVEHHGITIGTANTKHVYDLVPRVLLACAADTGTMDYDDQVWQTVTKRLLVEQFDILMVDECFVAETPVMLADGANMSIREMVETKYAGYVSACCTKTHETVLRRVMGWHKVPLCKRMVRVVTRRVFRKKDGTQGAAKTAYIRYGNRVVVCTEDQLIYTNAGWFPAGKLTVGAIVLQESHAQKDYKFQALYKHGRAGLANLGNLMRSKNAVGTCGTARSGLNNSLSSGKTPRGGNGRGLSPAESALLKRLGAPWQAHVIVTTGKRTGYPNHYKLDLANVEDKIALEVDGSSHETLARQAQDRKKETLLQELGWIVVRIKNEEVPQLSNELLHERVGNSPVEAEVLSVEEFLPKDPFVYDIDVEDAHNFYANGVLVHNCQDTNKLQQEFSFLVCPEGRIIVTGDSNQSLYGFRGADVSAIPNLTVRLSQSSRGAVELPLTVTRRCPKSHVRLAQALVPAIQAMDDAPEGVVECASTDKALTEMRPGDLVLCRANAPLVPVCYALIRHGVKAVIRGRDIGTGLLALIDKLIPASNRRIQSVHTLLENLTAYTQREMGKLARLGDRGASKVQALQDRQECLIALTDGVQSIDGLKAKIGVIFADFEVDGAPKDAVVLGSVHKTKGLEAGTVWVIAPELLPHPMAKRPWEQVQERNLAYVAATRAKYDKSKGWDGRLVFVQGAKSGGIPVCYSGKSISAVLHGREGAGTMRLDKAPVTAIADPREDYERIAAAHAKREVARRYRKETAQGVHNVLHAQEVGEMKRAAGERDDLWYGKGQPSPEAARADAECSCKWRGDKLVTAAACPVHGGER